MSNKELKDKKSKERMEQIRKLKKGGYMSESWVLTDEQIDFILGCKLPQANPKHCFE